MSTIIERGDKIPAPEEINHGKVIARRPLGKAEWLVIVLLGLDRYDPYVVWSVWWEHDQWNATGGFYTDDLSDAWTWFQRT